ncbi:MAG TPA: phospholipase D family protein [Anaeromyxobacteraceae bacterium]|nr:phospholipase D family protein [Anaeromyxobacteraceae bacterium]
MHVETVTTSDRSLLHAVRSTLELAEEAFLCVAFVQERGIHLLEKELDGLHRRRARTRLLVTTTFDTTSQSALAMARSSGLEVRVLNPGSGKTFHPKLYLGLQGSIARGVIGSANLTGGLATNLEAAVALRGTREDVPLARAWSWAEELWSDERAQAWTGVAAEPSEEPFEPDLLQALKVEVARNPVFLTLGRAPKRNVVVDLSPVELHVETERSRSRIHGAEAIPAWMFNLAWDRLRIHGSISNLELLEDLRVHRSSAVCAILGRLPQVERVAGREIGLRWR